jgi:outer membrane protein TolC
MRSGKTYGTAAWRWLGVAVLGAAMLVLSPAGGRADPVDLDQTIRQTLTGSLSLQRAKTKIEAANGQFLEAKSAFDWTTLAQTGWQRFLVPVTRNGYLTDSINYVDSWRTTVGVTKEFSNGITISPGVTTYVTPGVSVGQALGYTQTVPVVNLKIPLVRGLGEDSAGADERAAAARLNGTRLDYDYAAQKTVHDVVQLFWRCLADAQQRLVMLEADQEQTDYERWLATMVARGQMEPSEIQRAQAEHVLSNRELDRAGEGVLICRRQLSDAAGLIAPAIMEPVGDLPHPDRLGPAIARLREAPLVSYALDNRQDFRALKAYVEATRDKLKGAQDKLNPQVDVVLDPYQAYIRYTQPIGNDAGKGEVAAAMAAASEADIALRQGEQALRTEIANAVFGLKQLWLGWPALVGAQRKFERLMNDADRGVRRGTTDRIALRLAQDDLAKAQHAEIEARLRLASIVASLRLYTGSIVLDNDKKAALATEFSTLPAQ